MADELKTPKDIFMAALDKSATAERAAFLDEACAGDAELRQRVDALFHAHDQTDHVLDRPAVPPLVGANPPEPGHDAAISLDFLSPSTKPGSLGRLGHYEVLEVVGQGGMGTVLRAFDEKLHRIVAIKVLAPELASNGPARQRFVREARATAAVTHDNVIAIHAVEDDGPIPYLIMQFIQGCTLQQKLERTGQLPLKEMLRLGVQIADGLAAAHRHGLVHRDIKPSNILLENGIERVKITDFGLARAVDDASLTGSGYIAGTPAYMSPEQANGERVDYRSDLFSFGSVLYTLCAGHPPFQGDSSMAVLRRVCEDTPRPLREINPDLPEWLQALIAKLQEKDPANRFGSAAEVAQLLSRRLAQLQSGEPISDFEATKLVGARPEPPAAGRRTSAAMLVGAAVVGLGVVVAGWFIYQSWNAGGQEPTNGGTSPVAKKEDDKSPKTDPVKKPPAGPVKLEPKHTLMQHTRGVRTVAFSRDGATLASGGFDRNIYLWDTKTWEPRGPLEGHSGEISAVAFSPDGDRLASVTSSDDSCLIRVWDVKAAKQVETLGPAGKGMWDVAYSPDGLTLACGGWDKQLHLLEVKNGNERRVISTACTRHVRALSFSPDSRQIATGGSGPTQLWNADTGDAIPVQLKLPEGICPTILPGGKRVAGWSFEDGRVVVCDLPSGRIQKSWPAHTNTIEGLAVTRDGRFLATVGGDGLARVWSATDFTEVARLTGHKGRVFAVAFSPDGARLATGGADDLSIHIWDLPAICRTVK
jgi:serine/threonine protein kinase/WD40 repeat protein